MLLDVHEDHRVGEQPARAPVRPPRAECAQVLAAGLQEEALHPGEHAEVHLEVAHLGPRPGLDLEVVHRVSSQVVEVHLKRGGEARVVEIFVPITSHDRDSRKHFNVVVVRIRLNFLLLFSVFKRGTEDGMLMRKKVQFRTVQFPFFMRIDEFGILCKL